MTNFLFQQTKKEEGPKEKSVSERFSILAGFHWLIDYKFSNNLVSNYYFQ